MQTIGARFTCASCGEVNHTFIDPSQGEKQKYIEDCQVCCRPNELSIYKVSDYYEISAEAE